MQVASGYVTVHAQERSAAHEVPSLLALSEEKHRAQAKSDLLRAGGLAWHQRRPLEEHKPTSARHVEQLVLVQELLIKDVIVDMAKCISKSVTIRVDGIVPNLGKCCSRLLVLSGAQVISAKQ